MMGGQNLTSQNAPESTVGDRGGGFHPHPHADFRISRTVELDVCFVSLAPVERHARAGGHPVPIALVPWIPAFAGMTRGGRNW
jgi:hypothetical protein